jgi:hypothetical protein
MTLNRIYRIMLNFLPPIMDDPNIDLEYLDLCPQFSPSGQSENN